MDIIKAIDSPDLFAPHLKGNTWGPWRVFLKAFFGLPMDADEATLYTACTGRQKPPTAQFEEATLICGRRAGKSRILALTAVYLAAFRSYEQYLAPGEVATIGILAADRKQARSIFRYVHALLTEVPALAPLVQDQSNEQIVLTNRVLIEIATASFRATRGYTYAAVLADEIAFWRSDEGSANPDREILRALRPGLGTIPGAPLLLASSPYARKGALYDSFKRDWGNDANSVLCWKAATLTMHASKRLERLREEDFVKDPQSARAEWDGEFRDDLADFVTMEMVEAITAPGRGEQPPMPGVRYVAFCDPSGGVSDAMTLAIAHLEGNKGILDAVLVVQPPFDPHDAVASCAALLKRYNVVRVKSDRYAGQWVVSAFSAVGITVDHSERSKSDLYIDLLPLVTSKTIELLDNPRLKAELSSLERRTARSGKDSVDHAPNAHDDLANAVAGALVNVMMDRREPLIKRADLMGSEEEIPAIGYQESFYAVLWVAADGTAAWAMFGYTSSARVPLVIVDFNRGPWHLSVLDQVAERLATLRTATIGQYPAAHQWGVGVGLFVQDTLVQRARAALDRQQIVVQPYHRRGVAVDLQVDASILRDPVRLMLSASAQAAEGRVRLSEAALDRAGRVPVEGLLEVLPGQILQDDPLRLAMLVGIALADENAANVRSPTMPATSIRFG